MARPTKDDAAKLSRSLPPVRCTEDEIKSIQSKARQAELSLTEYIRRMVFKGKVIIREHNGCDPELFTQVRKIGINLNQQTKKLNATGAMPQELKSLWSKLDALLDQLLEKG